MMGVYRGVVRNKIGVVKDSEEWVVDERKYYGEGVE